MQYLSIDWGRWGGPTLAASSLIIAALQLTAACTDQVGCSTYDGDLVNYRILNQYRIPNQSISQVYLAYACYVGTSAIYHMLITAAW